jgi:DtxR family Mn-dependent transcriptional regulator
MNSRTEENYLKALLNLSGALGEVSVKDLSLHLGIKMPSVTSMMKRLAEKELVIYESYKPVRLSDKGHRDAALIIRKHRLAELFLVEKMGFRWDEVHDIAEQIEHIDALEFFQKMDELLDYPKFDPHGSPIPDKSGKMIWSSWSKLSACKKGACVRVTGVTNSSEDFLKFLNSRQISLGIAIDIQDIETFDGTMTVSYLDRFNETLSRTVSERILVESFE